jgi:acetyl esterase/lipase
MKKSLLALIVTCAFIITGTLAYGSAPPPSPPAAPTTGYGSPAKYICNSLYNGGAIDHNNAIDFGDTNAGTRCWVYIPSTLKNGATAPVVIYLHGFMAIVPPIYAGQIKHLVRQGYIVIFPEYNLGGFSGMFNDTNQYEQLGRAVVAVDAALSLPAVAARAEMGNIYLASHSNGGIPASPMRRFLPLCAHCSWAIWWK